MSNKYLIHYYQIINWPTPEGATIQRLYNGIIREAHIVAPAVSEQQKIAAILTTQDKVIELKEKRLAEKQRQKKYLMQLLLTGKKRLPGYWGEWNVPKAEEVFQSVIDKNHKGDLMVLSATQDKGIMPRNEVDIDIKYEVSSLDTVDNSQINVLTQRTMHRICTAATNEEVSFAYRVAIPRQRFRWRNAFSTRWRSL